MNFELAGVDGGKEVLPEGRQEKADGSEGEDGEENEEDGSVVDANGKEPHVTIAHVLKPVLKAQLKTDEGIAAGLLLCILGIVVLLQQVLGHGGHDSAGEQIAGQHGEHDRFGERHEKIARHAAEEKHGHEDDADGEGGNKGRGGDLRCAVEDGLLDFLAGLKVAVDVLDFHRCVVDQDADRQRQATQGHDVDGFVKDVEHDERTENGERNGDRDDNRGAEAAEKDQDHDGGEAGGDERLPDHAIDGAADKDRLIGQGVDLELGRKLALDVGEHSLHAGDDVERGRGAGFHDAHEDGALAVHADNVGLRGKAIAYMGDVADVDDGPVDRLDGKVVELIDHGRRGVGLHGVLEPVNLHGSGRSNEVLRIDGIHHIDGGKPFGLESVEVKVDLDLALLAAVGKGRLRSFNGGQLSSNVVRSQIVQPLLIHALPGKAQLQNRNAGGVVLDDEGRRGARRQAAQLDLADGGDLGDSAADVHMRLKEDFDDGDAVERLRLDVLNVIDGSSHAPLAVEDDAGGHFLGGEAAVLPDNRDDGDVDVRKDVCRHRPDAEGAKEEDQKRKDGKGVWPPKREPNNPHHRAGSRS